MSDLGRSKAAQQMARGLTDIICRIWLPALLKRRMASLTSLFPEAPDCSCPAPWPKDTLHPYMAFTYSADSSTERASLTWLPRAVHLAVTPASGPLRLACVRMTASMNCSCSQFERAMHAGPQALRTVLWSRAAV